MGVGDDPVVELNWVEMDLKRYRDLTRRRESASRRILSSKDG